MMAEKRTTKQNTFLKSVTLEKVDQSPSPSIKVPSLQKHLSKEFSSYSRSDSQILDDETDSKCSGSKEVLECSSKSKSDGSKFRKICMSKKKHQKNFNRRKTISRAQSRVVKVPKRDSLMNIESPKNSEIKQLPSFAQSVIKAQNFYP